MILMESFLEEKLLVTGIDTAKVYRRYHFCILIYSCVLDDVSSKTTEDKVVQRLSQLLEQSGTNIIYTL